MKNCDKLCVDFEKYGIDPSKAEVLQEVRSKSLEAKAASRKLATISRGVKDAALKSMAQALIDKSPAILAANEIDMKNGRKAGLSAALLDRLLLNDKRIEAMADGLRAIAELNDPVGEISNITIRPNGLQVGKMRVPLGVIGMVFEARPNVIADAAGLCIKSGNAVILKGGSEALESNIAIANVLKGALTGSGIPEAAVQLISTTDREAVRLLSLMDDAVDLLIARGGKGLLAALDKNATVPLVKHGEGICHTYIDDSADIDKAVEIAFNAKVSRPGVCNAMETLLVHKDIAVKYLPLVAARLAEAGVELRVDEKAAAILGEGRYVPATEEDWSTEYLDLILSIKVVDSIDEAIAHITTYGSGHSEAIVTSNYSNSRRFITEVDASAVFVNTSTRFNDGYQLGLGAEIGISTQKLHARGPMGLRELTCEKYVVLGDGQIRK